jgi:geranylgeranyl diphosphate synthase type II
MCYKKTCWYTFIAPIRIGALINGAEWRQLAALRKYATYIGIAFQIQDDVLNLVADEKRYGKEIGGDLWEGKHTLILMHMMRSASENEARRARQILAKQRSDKTEAEVRFLCNLIEHYGSLDYARAISQQMAIKAEKSLHKAYEWIPASIHRDFLSGMVDYIVTRNS